MGSRVYIGHLSNRAREKDLERFFKGFGKIRDITLKNGYGFVEFEDIRDADDAVYEMNGKELLNERVIVELSRGPNSRGGKFPLPHRFDLQKDRYGGGGGGGGGGGRGRSYDRDRYDDRSSRRGGNGGSSAGGGRNRERYGPPVRTDYRLVVENLSTRISWQDLKDLMRSAGEVTYADAHKSKRNEGVVEFATFEDMKKAIEKFEGHEMNGRKIHLVEEKRNKRSRSRSHRRSSSRSRSRSNYKKRGAGTKSRSPHERSPAVRIRDASESKNNNHHKDSSSRHRSTSKSRSKSRSASGSPVRAADKETSRSKSRTRSPSANSPRRQASHSPTRSHHNDEDDNDVEMRDRKSASKSRSRSPDASP